MANGLLESVLFLLTAKFEVFCFRCPHLSLNNNIMKRLGCFRAKTGIIGKIGCRTLVNKLRTGSVIEATEFLEKNNLSKPVLLWFQGDCTFCVWETVVWFSSRVLLPVFGLLNKCWTVRGPFLGVLPEYKCLIL